ncbi:HD domain-containing phosphohydrolase [Syntrophotalea acetylenica]|uniref:HD-GYP domain-containing protein n=1 Tax=Syntrophotalea TaxID=2812025 RepID=UPI002A368A9F|nr:HD domain-containing phosphohydrolase [Syntrophotalea acetylenica]MDY0261731.1 HD domain-containing phosphohydrolase [Syntrophotalea acetylenica]
MDLTGDPDNPRLSDAGKAPEGVEIAAEESFFSVNVDILDCVDKAPCDLYRRNASGQYVLLASRSSTLDRDATKRLQFFGIGQLFVHGQDSGCFSRILRTRLDEIVKNPHIEASVKARVVQASCRDAMRRAFDDPRGPFIRQACDMIVPTVDLIVQSDQATRYLIQLTSFDHATYVHSTNVGIFAVALARLFFGLDRAHDMHNLGMGFFLHDLGKCRIPIEILNKPGPLTEQERQVVNCHVEEGFRILEENGIITDEARTITLEHHEKDNGKGYPRGKMGADIHPYARICRIADIYEALTAERPYHRRRSTFDALRIMKEQEVADVDKALFAHFLQLFAG